MAGLAEEHAVAAVNGGRGTAGATVPVVFGVERTLFGVLSLPARGLSRDLGVVVCAPLGLENAFSYRPLRILARRLAEQGLPVLRFDWYGCGDSGEAPPSATGPDPWRDAIRDAVDAICAETGVAHVALLGLRIGATFALLEAADNPAVSDVALLSPYVKGRSYLRELRALEAILDPVGAAAPGAAGLPLPEGSVPAGGFLLTAAEVEALDAIDLGAQPLAGLAPGRTLLATTEPDRSSAVLAERLTVAGSRVTTTSDRGLAHLWRSATSTFLPASCREQIVDWLLAEAEPGSGSIVRPGGPATLSLAAGAIREQATTFETGRGQRFAVTCSPGEGAAASEDWVVFLNAGLLRRSGASRLSTDWARRWAPAGVNSLRFDLGGVGDSDSETMGEEIRINDISLAFRPEFMLDIHDALDWLADQHGARRFVLIGLCSGGTLAYEAARQDPRVAGIVVMNAPTLLIDRRVLSLIAWGAARRLVSGPYSLLDFVRAHGPGWTVRALQGALLTLTRRTYEVLFRKTILDSLARLQLANTGVAGVFAAGDSGLAFLERSLGPDYRVQLARLDVDLDIIEGPDHVFTQLWSHEHLGEVCARLLTSVGFLDPQQHEHEPAPGLSTAASEP